MATVNGSRTRDDQAGYSLAFLAGVSRDFGAGYDVVSLGNREQLYTQVRLTFTSAEVGNGTATDSGLLANQDGGLAVRVQGEDASGALTGAVGRFDDEGISFVSDGSYTFDVRDLVSGVERGTQFGIVRLGTSDYDYYAEGASTIATYINGGRGNDDINGGLGDDFLVGGAGNDTLFGGRDGNDSFIGGAGDDTITGGQGDDLAIFNISTDGADRVDLGVGNDRVNVAAAVGTSQIRLTFTSAEVGNFSANDAGTLANQDGGLAVRMQAEDATGELTDGVSRYDDEGVTFLSTTAGLTFDVRDLVSGVARGDQFAAVQLGSRASEVLDNSAATISYYVNGGQGNDVITGGSANDFLVGGAGADRLFGGAGDDSFIGGGGADTIFGGVGNDTAIFNVSTDGPDTVNLGIGADRVNVSAAPGTTQVRVTFTSAEVGNNSANDGGSAANQDGGLAVRVQAEDDTDGLTGAVGRFDDEGVTFFASTAGVTFDVRDLVSGTARGDLFAAVQLGTFASDTIDNSATTISYYVNGGQGNDTISGGSAVDFLVGGAGNDRLNGGAGSDFYLGGGGADTFVFTDASLNIDAILDFTSGSDKVDLSTFGIGFQNLTFSTIAPGVLVSVDSNADNNTDFFILFEGTSDAPVEGDFIF